MGIPALDDDLLVVGILAIRFKNKRFQEIIAVYWGFSLIIFVLSWQYSVAS